MGQLIVAFLVVIVLKLLFDNLKPAFNKGKSQQSSEFIDISEKWVNTDDMPYKINEYLLDNLELVVFKRLKDILENSRYSVYPHIRLADLLSVPAGAQNRKEYLFRISERSLDMVVFESAYLKPVLAVNLTSFPGGGRQQVIDQFTKKALHTAGLKAIDLDVNSPPSRDDLLNILHRSGLDI